MGRRHANIHPAKCLQAFCHDPRAVIMRSTDPLIMYLQPINTGIILALFTAKDGPPPLRALPTLLPGPSAFYGPCWRENSLAFPRSWCELFRRCVTYESCLSNSPPVSCLRRSRNRSTVFNHPALWELGQDHMCDPHFSDLA